MTLKALKVSIKLKRLKYHQIDYKALNIFKWVQKPTKSLKGLKSPRMVQIRQNDKKTSQTCKTIFTNFKIVSYVIFFLI